jgi:hypothetical protein
LGPADSLKWEVRGTPIPNLGLVEEQFDRFVQGYSHRLLKLLDSTTPRDYSESVTAALDAHPTVAPPPIPVESLPPVLSHFLTKVAPMLRAAKANLRVLSATEVSTLTQIVDVMLALGDCTSDDSVEVTHWLYAAGRQFAETLEAKGFVSQRRRSDTGVQATSDTNTVSSRYALAA